MIGMVFAPADPDCENRDYDVWLTALTEASARLDVLQTVVSELRRLCEAEVVRSEQVLQVFERHGL